MEKNPLGVRKGIWTPEEDSLLKKCVENYGEGKWHLVPLRAGLNRCRKSCRLRWLNYLNPNIKRGQFSEAEVDLIIRLHKLLGNRWSLIAGRIPGRTANDVKNFWNTHIDKKLGEPIAGRVNALKPITIRPQPRTLSNLDMCPSQETSRAGTSRSTKIAMENGSKKEREVPCSSSDECIRWWSNLLEMSTNHDTGSGQNMLVDANHNHNPLGGEDDDDDLDDFTTGIDIGQLMSFEDVP